MSVVIRYVTTNQNDESRVQLRTAPESRPFVEVNLTSEEVVLLDKINIESILVKFTQAGFDLAIAMKS